MIYQMPGPGRKSVFVASSDMNSEAAQSELTGWARGNGYRVIPAPRTFTVYGREQRTRQWVLLERGEEAN